MFIPGKSPPAAPEEQIPEWKRDGWVKEPTEEEQRILELATQRLGLPTETDTDRPGAVITSSETDFERAAKAGTLLEREPCTLVRVVDGDTVVVMMRGFEAHIRLLRINTPERGQPGFGEAKSALQALLDKASLALEFEQPEKPERDRYGRFLAYLWAGDALANVELVRQGHSQFWTKYGAGKYAERFKEAEASKTATAP